jgi:hypothetical protein
VELLRGAARLRTARPGIDLDWQAAEHPDLVSADELPNLIRDRDEDLVLGRLTRDERCDSPQSGRLVGQPMEIFAGLGRWTSRLRRAA